MSLFAQREPLLDLLVFYAVAMKKENSFLLHRKITARNYYVNAEELVKISVAFVNW